MLPVAMCWTRGRFRSYLGHRSIQSKVRYAELALGRYAIANWQRADSRICGDTARLPPMCTRRRSPLFLFEALTQAASSLPIAVLPTDSRATRKARDALLFSNVSVCPGNVLNRLGGCMIREGSPNRKHYSPTAPQSDRPFVEIVVPWKPAHADTPSGLRDIHCPHGLPPHGPKIRI